jgi:hypothetical protein
MQITFNIVICSFSIVFVSCVNCTITCTWKSWTNRWILVEIIQLIDLKVTRQHRWTCQCIENIVHMHRPMLTCLLVFLFAIVVWKSMNRLSHDQIRAYPTTLSKELNDISSSSAYYVHISHELQTSVLCWCLLTYDQSCFSMLASWQVSYTAVTNCHIYTNNTSCIPIVSCTQYTFNCMKQLINKSALILVSSIERQ